MKKDLFSLKTQEIADFLLNNKKGDFIDIQKSLEEIINYTGPNGGKFTYVEIYKDKNMNIFYRYFVIPGSEIIEEFVISSKFFGRIKNSYFTVNGNRGVFKNQIVGVLNLKNLKDWASGTNHDINNRNIVVEIEIIDFASLVAYCQRVFRASPWYGDVTVLSESPDPWVSVEIHMPDGEIYTEEGVNKKDASNKFAKKYAKKLKKSIN